MKATDETFDTALEFHKLDIDTVGETVMVCMENTPIIAFPPGHENNQFLWVVRDREAMIAWHRWFKKRYMEAHPEISVDDPRWTPEDIYA